MRTAEMIKGHKANRQRAGLVECINDCFTCAQACTTCADACLSEEQVAKLARCIRTDLDCADLCVTTGRVLSRLTEPDDAIIRAQLSALATACQSCAAECDKHTSMHEHCRVCAEACRACEKSCRAMLRG